MIAPLAEDLRRWPVDPPNVGVGDDSTADRERFEQVVRAHVAYVANMLPRFPDLRYALLDLNAGCGGFVWSKRPGVPQRGTLLRALGVLDAAGEAHGLSAVVGAIERDPVLALHLQERLDEVDWPDNPLRPEVLVGRHEDLAAGWVRRHMRGIVRGLIVHDPNAELSRETLGALAALRETTYVDFLLHVNGAIVKWHGTKGHPAVDEVLALCGKQYAYVGPLVGNWQWSRLLLSDDGRISTAGGLVRADRPEGEGRLRTLAHTRRELRSLAPVWAGQMGLFDGG